MPWIPPPSISVCRCFPGQGSAVPKPQSRCIPCSTCTAAFPRLSALQKAKPTTSISLISSFPKSVRSMSWIAATSIFFRLYRFTLCSAFFVVRTKENVLLQRRYSHSVDKSTGVRSDHTVILTAIESAKVYPETLRRVTYFDVENQRRLKFLTNNFFLPALTIARIYKSRWLVEIFFRFIKQNLRIKSFYGTSENAVKTQIWIAVSVYVLVAIVRKRLRLEATFYQILQILSLTLFEKMPILRALETVDSQDDFVADSNQLILFDF